MADLSLSKVMRLFLRRATSYIIIFLITLLMILPILALTQNNIRENTISIFQSDIDNGAYDLDNKMDTFIKLGSLIKIDSSYRKLLSVVGKPKSEMCLEINTLQKLVAQLCLPHEYIKDMYILFNTNNLYISNYIASEDYRSVYPLFLKEDYDTAENWRQATLDFPAPFDVQSSFIKSSYSHPQLYKALTLVTNITPQFVYSKRGILVCHISFDDIAQTIIRSDMIDDCFLYMEDKDGNIIASYNIPSEMEVAEQSSLSTAHDGYSIVKTQNSDFNYRLCMGIPNYYFYEISNKSYRVVLMYAIFGTLLILITSLFSCFFETKKFKKVMETASTLLPSVKASPSFTNEMAYINNMITASASQLKNLHETLKTHVLANLLFNPLPLEKMSVVEELYENTFDSYCVAVVKLDQSAEENSLHQYMFTFTELCRTMISIPYVYTHTNLNELSLLINLKHFSDNLSTIANGFARITERLQQHENEQIPVHIGISKQVSGPENACVAYNQAKIAISMFADSASSGVFLYNPATDSKRHKVLEIGLLSRCYDSILCGDSQSVQAFFAQFLHEVQQSGNNPQDQAQLLYSVRHPIYNAYLEVCSMSTADPYSSPFPELDLQQSFRHNIDILEKAAYEICNYVQGQKKLQNLRFKDNVMDFIYKKCCDAGFTPYMVANEFHISESHVLNLVKEVTGKSLKAFIENLRVDKAEELLRSSEFTNTQIATACGFGSENTFYRAFSRRHGISPSKWADR